MPWFFHRDIKSQYFHFQFLKQGIVNIYQHVETNKPKLPNKDTFNYLPLTYFTFGTYNILASPLLPKNYSLWLNDWGINQNNYIQINHVMLILKLPYLILDILLAIFLLKIFGNDKIFKFWLFNPLTIYLIYVLGNFDILPCFLTVLSFYFLTKNKDFLCFFFLGIAFALKAYPILFLPFFLFYHKFKFRNIIYFALPAIFTIIPFIFLPNFLSSFVGSGLTQKLLEYKFQKIPIYPSIYLIIFIQYYFSKNKPKRIFKNILYLSLFFFAFVKFHPQWLIWFFPFIIEPILKKRLKAILFLIFIIFIFFYIMLIDDNYLTWGHLITINHNFINLTTPFEFIKNRFNISPFFVQNIIKNILIFFSITSIILYEKDK